MDDRSQPNFTLRTDATMFMSTHEASGTFSAPLFSDEVSVSLDNDAAENGYNETAGPLDWVNSAKVRLVPEDDAVYLSVSIGDPRGAFVFTVRRLSDGRVLIHTPYPEESLPHVKTKELHPGTLEVEGNFATEEVE